MKVLFLCTGNSCRSQMAEAWAKHLWKDSSYEFFSAGIEIHGMNPYAVTVMQEAGLDLSGHYSKTLAQLSLIQFDVVVTVCSHADQTCPSIGPGIKKIHAGFDDPPRLAKSAPNEQAALDCYRQVRDQIKQFVSKLDQLL